VRARRAHHAHRQAPARGRICAGALLIFTSHAESPTGQVLNLNADVVAGELMKELEALKIIFLNDNGGLFHGVTGERRDVITRTASCTSSETTTRMSRKAE
jgi:acetylglutamate kinase